MDKVLKIRAINSLVGRILKTDYKGMSREYEEMGFSLSGHDYGKWLLTMNGITLSVREIGYCGDCEVSNEIQYGGRWYRNAETAADDISDEDVPRYERSEELQSLVDEIKARWEKFNGVVRSVGRYGTPAQRVRNMGGFVEYDGGSVCDFEHDGIRYSAMNGYPSDGWNLNKAVAVILSDGREIRIPDVGKLDFAAERFLYGAEGLGRRKTEKDKANEYKSFRVRTYAGRELKTLKTFDDLEEAKRYALEKARELAARIPSDLQCYAHTNPIDISDKYDCIAGWLYYSVNGRAEHIVYVYGDE